MKLQFRIKSLLLIILLVALVLTLSMWWARRPVIVYSKDGTAYPMRGYSAVLACVMHGDDENLSRLFMFDSYDLNQPSTSWTILQHAIQLQHGKCVRILLENGADPNLHFNGPKPLDIAQRKGNREIIALLKEHGAN